VLRIFYQNPFVEPTVLLGSLIAHLVSSGIRIYDRAKLQGSVWAKLKLDLKNYSALAFHRVSGWFLAAAIAGHVYATRVSALGTQSPLLSGFSVVAFSLHKWPIAFYPYYVTFGICGVYHLCYGVREAYRFLKPKTPENPATPSEVQRAKQRREILFWSVVGIGAVGCVAGILAMGGKRFVEGEEGFSILKTRYEQMLPVFLVKTIL